MLRENIRVMYQGYGSDTYLDNGTLGDWFDGDISKLSLGAQFDLDGLKAWLIDDASGLVFMALGLKASSGKKEGPTDGP